MPRVSRHDASKQCLKDLRKAAVRAERECARLNIDIRCVYRGHKVEETDGTIRYILDPLEWPDSPERSWYATVVTFEW